MIGIYAITSPSGKGYIGSSVRLAKRRTRHFSDLRNGRHHCVALQSAWNKYGDRLTFVVIEHCSKDVLVQREQFWLDNSIFIALYNSNKEAGNSIELSDDVKRRLADARRGVPLAETTKAKMRGPKTAEHAAAISLGKKARKINVAPNHAESRKHCIAKASTVLAEMRKNGQISGHKHSEETKLLMRKPKSPEHTEKLRASAAKARTALRLKRDSAMQRDHMAMLNWIVG